MISAGIIYCPVEAMYNISLALRMSFRAGGDVF
jgi:hypothetical protein